MKNIRYNRLLIVVALLFTATRKAEGQILLVDHQPHPYGGPSSDTLFTTGFGQPYWQRLADDFVLGSPSEAIALTYWGFYDADNPPPAEAMRIRILGARAGDMLPDEGNVLSETTVQNPSRAATGRFIGVGILPKEYRYEAILAAPVSFMANTKYWLEIVQLGDITTKFRWEDSVAEFTGHAFVNPATGGDWYSSLPGGDADLAFQLISPEPASLAMLAVGIPCLWRRRKSRGERGTFNISESIAPDGRASIAAIMDRKKTPRACAGSHRSCAPKCTTLARPSAGAPAAARPARNSTRPTSTSSARWA